MERLFSARAATPCAFVVLLVAGCVPPVNGEGPSMPTGAPAKSTVLFKARSGCDGMAQIPGGNLAAVGGEPRSAVVQPFCIDKSEVTVSAYDACVTAGKCSEAGTGQSGFSMQTGETCNRGVVGREEHAINCVDWSQAKTYCEAVGGRLPTEEEWEWTARGGDRASKFPWGDAAPGPQACWGMGRKVTCPVGSFPAGDNPWGVHDLAGNLAEWTSSVFKEGQNTVVGSGGKVVRGGSYFVDGMAVAPGRLLAAAESTGEDPTNKLWRVGFRCVTAALPDVAAAAQEKRDAQDKVDAEAHQQAVADTAALDAAFARAKRADTAAAWAEFLRDHPDAKSGDEARQALARALYKGKALTIHVTSTGTKTCSSTQATGLTQSALVSHLNIVGKTFTFKCPSGVSFTYAFVNPTRVPLTVQARAVGKVFQIQAKSNGTTTGKVDLPGGCDSAVGLPPTYSPGAVTFACSNQSFLPDVSVTTTP
jgi:hypothetical protein